MGGAGFVYNFYSAADNVDARGTAVTIAGTDGAVGSKQTWELNFLNSGIDDDGDTIIEVNGTID